jgi:hypothetical protein
MFRVVKEATSDKTMPVIISVSDHRTRFGVKPLLEFVREQSAQLAQPSPVKG